PDETGAKSLPIEFPRSPRQAPARLRALQARLLSNIRRCAARWAPAAQARRRRRPEPNPARPKDCARRRRREPSSSRTPPPPPRRRRKPGSAPWRWYNVYRRVRGGWRGRDRAHGYANARGRAWLSHERKSRDGQGGIDFALNPTLMRGAGGTLEPY